MRKVDRSNCVPGVNCPAMAHWMSHALGLTPGYRNMVTRYGAIGAARRLMSAPMKSGILKVPWQLTLEGWVLTPKYRCLFNVRDRGVAERRLSTIGVINVTEATEEELPAWKMSCPCFPCPGCGDIETQNN